jgi:hypothetical protein
MQRTPGTAGESTDAGTYRRTRARTSCQRSDAGT